MTLVPMRRAAVVAMVVLSPLAVASPAGALGRVLHTGASGIEAGAEATTVVAGSFVTVDQSPDGTKVAAARPDQFFTRGPERISGEVVVAKADGACPIRLPGGGSESVSWAPDGVRLARTGVGVGIVNTGDPSAPTTVVPGTADAGYVDWNPSPSRDLIAYSTLGGDIVTVDLRSGERRTLLGGPTYDTMPAWSPDGGRLAWIRRDSGSTSQLWVGDGDGGNARLVATAGLVMPERPSWTRDGTGILLADTSDPSSQGSYLVDPTTGATTRQANGGSPIEAPLLRRSGYVVVAGDGSAYGFGSSCSAPGGGFRPVAVASARRAANPGHWQVDAEGRVRAFGAARSFGDLTGRRLNQPIVGMDATPTGEGYWLVARDGGVFTFGDAGFFGSTGAMRLNQPIVGMAGAPDGGGYWLVAADGGVFSFGSATFFGSTGAMRLNQPVVGMRATDQGRGYWLVARDGGIFTFGDAAFSGSTGGIRLARPIVGMASLPGRRGYWLVAGDGGVFAFGDHPFLGSTGSIRIPEPAAGMVVETVSASG